MTTKVRISAEDPADAEAITQALAAAGLDVAGGERDYPNRSGFGFRRYIEVRVPHRHAVRANAARTDRTEIEGNDE